MRIALISVTRRGSNLCMRISQKLIGTYETVCYGKNGKFDSQEILGFDSLHALMEEKYSNFDGFIFVMATGIVVRVLAPYITDKRKDPAVLVIDEAGEHVISLLSGHIGGANCLAKTVAAEIAGKPVITTATDVNSLPAVDLFAVKVKGNLEPFNQLKSMNGAIVDGQNVAFFLDETLLRLDFYENAALEMGIHLLPLAAMNEEKWDGAVIISDRLIDVAMPHIFIRPRTLMVGIGCRRGTEKKAIKNAVEEACRQIERSTESIDAFGSVEVKRDEAGLLAMAAEFEKEIFFFSKEELQESVYSAQLPVSDFVMKTIGVGNVCEAAALQMGKTRELLLAKKVVAGITVAIARASCK